MYYTIYKTTNLVNGRYYVGAHQTNNPLDCYLGSGKLLERAIKKYGTRSFKKEVLFLLSSAEEMMAKELEIVDAAFVARPETYNLNIGGEGSWYHVGRSIDQHGKAGAPHTEAHKARMRSLVWIRRGEDHARIPREGLELYLSMGWRQGICQSTVDSLKGNQRTAGKVWAWNPLTNESRLVEPALLEDFTAKGWNRGRRAGKEQPVRASPLFGRVRVRKDGRGKLIPASDLDSYLANGWEQGLVRGKADQVLWIHNASENRRVSKEQIDTFLADGWVRGRRKLPPYPRKVEIDPD